MPLKPPTLDEISTLRERLVGQIQITPVLRCPAIEARLDSGTEVWGKLEFLQRTGTFKARGALSNLLQLDRAQLAAGVTAVSAGNHAIATAFAADASRHDGESRHARLGKSHAYRSLQVVRR